MKMQSAMMDQCEEMKKAKQQMRADMKAQDDKISAMVASMNNAAQEKKLELLASIVTHLVEQRTAMHAKNAEMEEKMIKHMMAHMETDRESLSKCPMMEKMDEKSK